VPGVGVWTADRCSTSQQLAKLQGALLPMDDAKWGRSQRAEHTCTDGIQRAAPAWMWHELRGCLGVGTCVTAFAGRKSFPSKQATTRSLALLNSEAPPRAPKNCRQQRKGNRFLAGEIEFLGVPVPLLYPRQKPAGHPTTFTVHTFALQAAATCPASSNGRLSALSAFYPLLRAPILTPYGVRRKQTALTFSHRHGLPSVSLPTQSNAWYVAFWAIPPK